MNLIAKDHHHHHNDQPLQQIFASTEKLIIKIFSLINK